MKRLLTAAAAAAFSLGGFAHAAILNFATYADDNAAKIANGAAGQNEVGGVANGTVINFGTIDIRFSAENNGVAAFAYFDGSSGRTNNEAGLGVCNVINSSKQCRPAGDDNTQLEEVVTLDFLVGVVPVSVDLGGFTFRTAQHNALSGTVQVAINGGSFVTMTTADLAMTNALSGVSSIAFKAGSEEFYVEGFTVDDNNITQVPLPAAVLLFAPFALGLARRRRG